ncbi:DUF1847 domain-containing protein [Anaeroselena agilis]|uniref:DUF1847 domain-containing protein n=1 Tax=Anaeroselena agilis TaxID=3063788 RepID=A0ABU3NSK3_9FIRM|nr:DUF1847 domain-containing protein [Selenomonadales bacterium 4137-cl]
MTKGKCALCKIPNKICRQPGGHSPAFCSTNLYGEAIAKAAEEYEKADIHEFARLASVQEAECYIDREANPHYLFPVKPRIQEIIEFSHKMGYRRLGLAFCAGLHQEAEVVSRIFEGHGLEVVSVICKVGGVPKETIDIKPSEHVKIGEYETMCNPIAQAEVLNAAGTDFNVLLGLCVGHDSLFIKYSQAMVSVLAVKDRVLGHNPLAAIYTNDSYYQRFKNFRLKELTVKDGKQE